MLRAFSGACPAPQPIFKELIILADKLRLHLRLSPEVYHLIDEYAKKDNCSAANEFVERAVMFYVGYLSANDCLKFLPPALASAVRSTVQSTENRISRLLFKLAVEMDMMMNVLASAVEIDREDIREQRGRSIQNVKKTGGSIALEDAVENQRGGV